MRDHNGERGPVPTSWREHDWQTCRTMRVLGATWWLSRISAGLVKR